MPCHVIQAGENGSEEGDIDGVEEIEQGVLCVVSQHEGNPDERKRCKERPHPKHHPCYTVAFFTSGKEEHKSQRRYGKVKGKEESSTCKGAFKRLAGEAYHGERQYDPHR